MWNYCILTACTLADTVSRNVKIPGSVSGENGCLTGVEQGVHVVFSFGFRFWNVPCPNRIGDKMCQRSNAYFTDFHGSCISFVSDLSTRSDGGGVFRPFVLIKRTRTKRLGGISGFTLFIRIYPMEMLNVY